MLASARKLRLNSFIYTSQRFFQKNSLKSAQSVEKPISTSIGDFSETLNIDDIYNKIGSKSMMSPLASIPAYENKQGPDSFLNMLGTSDPRFHHIISTSYDKVEASNSNHLFQIWNVFNACVQAQDFTRADALLTSLYHLNTYLVSNNISQDSPIFPYYIQGLCNLLEGWSKDENSSLLEIRDWFNRKVNQDPNLRHESKVFATMIRALINKKVDLNDILLDFTAYFQITNTRLLDHIDIIGFDNMNFIIQKIPSLIDRLPEDYKDLFRADNFNTTNEALGENLQENDKEYDDINLLNKANTTTTTNTNTTTTATGEEISLRSKLESLKKDLITTALEDVPEDNERDQQTTQRIDFSLDPGTIKNEMQDLISVESMNIKALRNSLLGLGSQNDELYLHELKAKFPEIEEFLPELKIENDELEEGKLDDGSTGVLDRFTNNSIDFFELKKKLTLERQAEFEQFLDAISEERERKLEENILEVTRQKWEFDFEKFKDKSVSSSVNAYLCDWQRKMIPIITQQIAEYKEARTHFEVVNNSLRQKVEGGKKYTELERKNFKSKLMYGPFLSLLSPQKLATITLLELIKSLTMNDIERGVTTVRSVTAIGSAIELEYKSEQILSKEVDVYNNFKSIKKTPEFKKFLRSKKAQSLINDLKSKNLEVTKDVVWDTVTSSRVGSALISIALKVAKIEIKAKDPKTNETKVGLVPAFYHTYEHIDGAKVGVIKAHSAFGSKLGTERLTANIPAQSLPMICKPRPWTNYREGGYFVSNELVLRTKRSSEQYAYMKSAAAHQKLDKIYTALNNIGYTPWTVNKKLLETVTQVWNTGEQFLEIPKFREAVVLPPEPDRTEDPSVLYTHKLKARKTINEFCKDRSMRCDMNYKLEIARALVGERFYFPHSLDFRGRSYPIPSLFNHLGNDLARSLLIFWNGKELGEDGVKWLKVHLCNMMGFDKLPLEERIQFTDNHIEEIIDSAENPLGGKGWWKNGDKPWQCLATCIELSEMYKMDDPTKFISHQPIHQDGTCNGLQHYAALGGDYEGATQVNLIPRDRPSDVYTHVSKIVQRTVDQQAAEGNEYAIKSQNIITRKLVKQTVMTSVYGVTFVGAKEQIARRLKEATDLEDEDVFKLANFLTVEVFKAIRELFGGAHKIQDWFEVAAGIITRCIRLDTDPPKSGEISHLSSVIWTTPLGLPVVQPYRSLKRKQIETNLQTITIGDPNEIQEVDSRKQINAFPPNYIHSLDATHMLMSATACTEEGLDFASVHDSYWTHAADVTKMSTILREQFIALHSADLIAKLKSEFERRYEGFLTIKTIPASSPVAAKLVRFRKDFSKKIGRRATLADEVSLERERFLSLRSGLLERVEFGKNMETSVSILTEEDLQYIHNSKTKNTFKVLVPFKLPDVPERGDFDVSVVKDSVYFFS